MKRTITWFSPSFSLSPRSPHSPPPLPQGHKSMATELKGTIASIDDPAKTFVLKLRGQDNTISWTTQPRSRRTAQGVGERRRPRLRRMASGSRRRSEVEPAKTAAATKK